MSRFSSSEPSRRSRACEPRAFLETAMDAVVRIADAQRGSLYLREPDGLRLVIERREAGAPSPQPCPVSSRGHLEGQGPCEVLTGGRSTIRCPLSGDPCAHGFRGAIVVRLREGGAIRALGLLGRRKRWPRPPTRAQLALIECLFEEMRETAAASPAAGSRGAMAEGTPPPGGPPADGFAALIGRDPALLRALADARAAAVSDLPVLIVGETGTGKELVARAIHRTGRRSGKTLLALNCSAVPGGLGVSELFGHARGSFTGAAVERGGLFEAADGGTIFLDEVGDMSPELQPALLRVLEAGEVRRIGETHVRHVDVRVIAATAREVRDPSSCHLRRDLLFRLAAMTIRLPPLRERRGDIPELAEHLLRRACGRGCAVRGLSPRALDALLAHDWPGNVRELENTMRRAALLARGPLVDAEDLRLAHEGAPEALVPRPEAPASPGRSPRSFRETEAAYFEELLAAVAQNRSAAARIAAMPRSTLLARLRRLGLARSRKQ